MSPLFLTMIVLAASEEGHESVNEALNWGVGGGVLLLLLGLMGALVAFGGGREHS